MVYRGVGGERREVLLHGDLAEWLPRQMGRPVETALTLLRVSTGNPSAHTTVTVTVTADSHSHSTQSQHSHSTQSYLQRVGTNHQNGVGRLKQDPLGSVGLDRKGWDGTGWDGVGWEGVGGERVGGESKGR